MTGCLPELAWVQSCRDAKAATHLKIISIVLIFVTGVMGVSSPVMLARCFQGKKIYDKVVLVIKCFAAGVILSTSLVHVLPDANNAFADRQVLSKHPWKDFPFTGFVTMLGALLALLVDITATSHVHNEPSHYMLSGTLEDSLELLDIEKRSISDMARKAEELEKAKRRLVSQVLEIGIIFHSVIIGVTMGMSQNQCTIRPLVAALAFHQTFEGLGLGGCIAQASFNPGTTLYMCFMFSVTTPIGILLGMIVFSMTGYDDSNPKALIMEGLLGSLSSGILIYMALVDLIAADFFHNRMMSSEPWLNKICFIALVFGSFSMSLLAIWS
ncbi:hypothetical protein GIB67_036709 [Kingdonia uniflora]|uniref:Uncharacterized protein n=1 Tax=Kingdonia uniflora TaxID=39325 RepID=A0A7J7LWT3_9MAGN|nr:hypothetical protein GIB67_036709 [Kingdonia uniflora]